MLRSLLVLITEEINCFCSNSILYFYLHITGIHQDLMDSVLMPTEKSEVSLISIGNSKSEQRQIEIDLMQIAIKAAFIVRFRQNFQKCSLETSMCQGI